jgi:two-component system, chemotaxis family, protein-glutamate methylesterase/glutaminase
MRHRPQGATEDGRLPKVLIVDDSALMRRHLREILGDKGGFTVLAVRNGVEALAALDSFDADVITLDINMPEMDGITCLSHIMTKQPRPVVMVSSLTERGAEITFAALALGAVDFIHKPDGTISLSVDLVEKEILAKVTSASRARIRRSVGAGTRVPANFQRELHREVPATLALNQDAMGVVLIGVSTGGPGTLEEILPKLPRDLPWPVLVAQHMPANFTTVFARRLNEMCELTVVEAASMMPLEPGVIYIGKGDADVVVGKRPTGFIVNPTPADSQFLWHPSVARMVDSAMRAFPPDRIIGVLLTGMGDDGAERMAELHRLGSMTIAQDEASSIIYGMPGELVRRGGASIVLPAARVARQLTSWLVPAARSTASPVGRSIGSTQTGKGRTNAAR